MKNGIHHWEFFYRLLRALSKLETMLRVAGWTQFRALDSGVSNRITSEVGQSIEIQSPRLGLADLRPFRLDGHLPEAPHHKMRNLFPSLPHSDGDGEMANVPTKTEVSSIPDLILELSLVSTLLDPRDLGGHERNKIT